MKPPPPRRPPAFLALLFAALLAALATSPSGPLSAQEPAATGEQATEVPAAAEPAFPDRSQVGPRYLALVDGAAPARRRIAELSEVADLEEDLGRLAERGDELGERVDRLLATPRTGFEALVDARQAVSRHRDSVAALVDRASTRIAELDRLRAEWIAARELWDGWRADLERRGDLAEFRADFRRAEGLIGEVLDLAGEAVADLAAAQAPMRGLQESGLELLDRLDTALTTQRAELFDRNAPAIPSAAFVAELRDTGTWFPRAATEGVPDWPAVAWFEVESAALALQLLVFLAAFFVARHFRRRYPEAEDRWRILLSHPVAIGLFVAASFTPLLYTSLPPLWRLLLLAVLAGAAAVLTRGMFRNPRKRRVVYVLAAFYVLLVALETLGLSGPGDRLVSLAAAGAGIPFLLVLARREERHRGRRNGFAWLLYAGASVLAAVLAAQLLGFATLARWLLDNALTTAFIAFTTVFLVRLGRGALRAALHRPRAAADGRLVTLRRVGYELSGRLSRGLELVLVVVALLYVLTVWGVFASPWAGWRGLAAGGVELGGQEITLSQVLLGALAVYLAFVVSGVLKALVGEELGQRPELEPGIADSVSTLAHYALVTLGVFVALAVLGFDLSSFAIVAGALGVGIGFGLQNMVNNFLSGLILLFERPVRVGDVVIIDGTWATIRNIGLRATVVTTFDQSEIIVPNGDLVSEKVTNWTLTDTKTRIVLALGVAYGSDLETVFGILREVAAADPRVAEDPAPLVHFVDFGDSALLFEVRVWVAEISERLNLRSDLLREIDRRFRAAGVTVPFPQRDVHLVPGDGGEAGSE